MHGIIEWMVRHPVASNLLMIFLIFSGVISLFMLKTETFPELTIDTVEVTVEYPGASPLEIEDSIIKRIEEQVEGIDGIDEVISFANENIGTVRLELMRGQDLSKKRDEVKTAIDQITAFPEESEEPQVSEILRKQRVLQLAIYGDIQERSLKEIAHKIKDDLTSLSGISYVTVTGVRDYEISIEIPRDTLRAYEFTLPEISSIVRQESLDLPGGDIETADTNILLRTVGRNYYQNDFEEIIVASNENGARVKLNQIANVIDGFVDIDLVSRFNGQPVAMVNVYRVGDEPLMHVVNTATDYFENTLEEELPPNVDIKIWRNDAEEFITRMETLRKNGVIALFLVVTFLTLFLNTKVAFWVSAGIGIAFLGSFAVMQNYGLSLNNVSSFGLILAIGIVVDDAIVVGENIYASRQHGMGSIDAAVAGAKRVSTPVIFAVTTTLAAFLPLVFLPGTMGMMMDDIPIMVIFVLALSLIEALLILPHHLAGALSGEIQTNSKNLLTRMQNRVDENLLKFVEGPLTKALTYVTRHYWVTICAGFCFLMIGLGVAVGGYIKFEFFPIIESRYITATIEMEEGTSAEETLKVAEHLEQTGLNVAEELSAKLEGPNLLTASYVLVGANESEGGPQFAPGGAAGNKSHIANVVIELLPSEQRDLRSSEFENQWRQATGIIPDARRVQFSSGLIQLASAVGIEVSTDSDEELNYAIREIRSNLSILNGVKDIRDDNNSGKTELKLKLRPEARSYGITLQGLASQIRGAFFGAEALRVQRGREEVKVYVRLPKEERNTIDDLANYWIRTPGGEFIPLWEVAEIEPGLSPTTINRRNGKRIVTVTADTDTSVITGNEIIDYMEQNAFPEILRNTSTVEFSLGGENRQVAELLPVLLSNLAMAMFAIYVLLAIPFRSYIQPVIVMSAIPFAWIGALFGHYVMGFNMSIVSLFGVIGLSGVIINGALVLLDFANEGIAKGKDIQHALIDAAKSRFRPILLTSMTTFIGVSPIMADTSLQGQFLVPIAISLGFGVLFGTPILILMVPALTMAVEQFKLRVVGKKSLVEAT